MNKIDLYSIYVIGYELHAIISLVNNDVKAGDIFLPLWSANRAINELLSLDSPVKLDFCRPAALKLKEEIKKIGVKYLWDENGSIRLGITPDVPINSWELYGLKDAISAFETVFQTEMQRAATYLVEKRGTYDTSDLVDRADNVFSTELKGVIGERALSEYRAAGRCFAFGLYTASGYHCCRAAEAMLREYFRTITGQTDTGNETWGQLIADLEKVKAPKEPDVKTLGHIRHLKDHDRNPLMHLKADLELIDADILLSASKVAISAMAAEIFKKNFEIVRI